jgi:hypothetical protein
MKLKPSRAIVTLPSAVAKDYGETSSDSGSASLTAGGFDSFDKLRINKLTTSRAAMRSFVNGYNLFFSSYINNLFREL